MLEVGPDRQGSWEGCILFLSAVNQEISFLLQEPKALWVMAPLRKMTNYFTTCSLAEASGVADDILGAELSFHLHLTDGLMKPFW